MIPQSLMVVDPDTGEALYPAMAGGFGGGGAPSSPPPTPMYRHPVYSRYSNASMPFPYTAAYENPKHAESPTAIRIAEQEEKEMQAKAMSASEAGFRYGQGEAYETREAAVKEWEFAMEGRRKSTSKEYLPKRPYVKMPGVRGPSSAVGLGVGGGSALSGTGTSPYLGGTR